MGNILDEDLNRVDGAVLGRVIWGPAGYIKIFVRALGYPLVKTCRNQLFVLHKGGKIAYEARMENECQCGEKKFCRQCAFFWHGGKTEWLAWVEYSQKLAELPHLGYFIVTGQRRIPRSS